MAKANTQEQDLIDGIAEHRESILGRDLMVLDMNMSYRGPISDIRTTSSGQLVITIEWRATSEADTWHLVNDHPYQYDVAFDKIVLRFSDDDAVDIIVQHGWIGKILSINEAGLEKPAI